MRLDIHKPQSKKTEDQIVELTAELKEQVKADLKKPDPIDDNTIEGKTLETRKIEVEKETKEKPGKASDK
jgi:hypothetical protein